MAEKELYEEYKVATPFWSWVVLLAFTLFVFSTGMFLHMLIGDRPQEWSFGELPDAPGESVYSAVRPSGSESFAPLIAPLPEAKPLRPEDGKGGRP